MVQRVELSQCLLQRFILSLVLLSSATTGLQCYECLFLNCDSGAICESIKNSMVKIFGSKRHNIDFDPKVTCPESSPNQNDTQWSPLVQTCPRSDSVCLFAPIKVLTEFDGLRYKVPFTGRTSRMSGGYLRGCASRRAVTDEDTISVRMEMVNESLAGIDQNSFSDGYKFTVLHSHEFFIELKGENSYRCYQDICNDRSSPKRGRGNGGRLNGQLNIYFLTLSALLQQSTFFRFFTFNN